MTEAGSTGGEERAVVQPWHVPQLTDDALAEDLPPAVADAARRALAARRPGVAIAELRDERLGNGHLFLSFVARGVSVDLQVTRAGERRSVRIHCPERPRGLVEVMHGDATQHLVLDEACTATVESPVGLFSVQVKPAAGPEPAVQTAWIRLA